ncbi:MAG: universal stress protein [Deltaproteobacteria bacterium]|nr:universal stress protein [Deltaproteobacteria bacterium]
MEKRILIAVDGSAYSRKAMEYAAGIGSIVKDIHYTLLHVHPKVSEYLVEDAKKDHQSIATLRKAKKKNHEESMRLLDKSKDTMFKLGISENKIETVSQEQTRGTAKAILDHGKKSLCDAIVLGRRGVSRLAETFVGSITNSVLEHTDDTPVWAIGGDVKPSKIMIAVDGSESSLRAVDHVSFMLEDNPDSKITLLHVTPRLRDYCTIDFNKEGEPMKEMILSGDKQCVDSFYIRAKEKFKKAGMSESQIDIREVTATLNIGKTIVDEALKGGFGTVVVGRRGINNSFFMGSVSSRVLTNAKDCAVWLVP